jgi:Tfp pilus assembly protein PilN
MALREINLIPADILARRHVWRHLSFWGMTLGFVVVLIFGFHLYQRQFVLASQQIPGNLEDIQSAVMLTSEQIKALQAEIKPLKQKRDVIRQIAGSLRYTVILATLADRLNASTWCTQISLERDPMTSGAANLKIQGSSFGNEELGNFLTRLSEKSVFQNISLKYARETLLATSEKISDAPMEVTHFQIECQVTRNNSSSKTPLASHSKMLGGE